MTSKSVDTLVPDIHLLFSEEPHESNPEHLKELGERVASMISRRLTEVRSDREFTLRMSNIGKPDRQLWYEKHLPQSKKQDLNASAKIKFLYGDLLELLLLFLAKEAGHDVSEEQGTVEVNGIKGSCDAVIDGVVVDVKSASSFSFKKFQDGRLAEDDPFGYMEQLAGYSAGFDGLDGGFLVIDKTLGHITLMQVPKEELAALNIPERIEHLKEVLNDPVPPPRCYEPKEEGKSGNLVLSIGCSYCPFKFHCWQDANDGVGVRTFLYSTGPKHFVKIEKEPKGPPEVTF